MPPRGSKKKQEEKKKAESEVAKHEKKVGSDSEEEEEVVKPKTVRVKKTVDEEIRENVENYNTKKREFLEYVSQDRDYTKMSVRDFAYEMNKALAFGVVTKKHFHFRNALVGQAKKSLVKGTLRSLIEMQGGQLNLPLQSDAKVYLSLLQK